MGADDYLVEWHKIYPMIHDYREHENNFIKLIRILNRFI